MIVTFLTDFGLQDDFVGTCHGVIARIAPDARVIDITHGIEPQAVLQGAIVLRNTLPYLPVGVHLAVVDPGVGSHRRAIALRTRDGRHFVGPDNGLLTLAARDVEAAHELVHHRLEPTSRTFHARDIFSPAAAHLASGLDIAELGPAVDPSSLVQVDVPAPKAGSATVLVVDRFGNIATNLRREDLPEPGTRVEVGLALDRYYAVVAETFADVPAGELILYEDSYGMVTLAISNGNAARLTGAVVGDELTLA
ncbi:MAG TPA: SAM-dependent chlorinase/fluorinase [Gaiellaceae bacterium]|nr:SAM-dependent chlorinase/fluorinase [Gaiellaceae bacterium]